MDTESQDSRDARVESLWAILDTRKAGWIDLNGLRKGLTKINHPLKDADGMINDVLAAVDTNHDGRIQYSEFRSFVEGTEKKLWTLFKSIDRDRNGKLDKFELQDAFKSAGLAISHARLDQFFDEVDTKHDGVITFDEWRDFLLFIPSQAPSLRAVLSYFSSTVKVNPEGDVHISDDTVQGLGTDLHFPTILFGAIIRIASPPKPRPPSTYHSSHHAAHAQIAEPLQPLPLPRTESVTVTPEADLAWYTWRYWKPVLTDILPKPGYFLAGGIAGIVSRTSTAPLDRLKVYLIAQTSVAKHAVEAAKQGAAVQVAKQATRPLIDACKELWRAGGMRSLFAGNGLNVIKVMPESAIKFGSYEGAKRMFARLEGHGDPNSIHSWSKFMAGGVSGMVSQFVLQAEQLIVPANLKQAMRLPYRHIEICETVEGGLHGNKLILQTAKRMWARNGMTSFYRGLPLGLVGMFPYAALDLGTFEYLKRAIMAYNARIRGCPIDDAAPGSFTTAAIGAFSGAFGASVVYPLNLLRTRLQSQGTAVHPRTYTGFMDVTRQTIRGEGVRGLFKGLTPNLLKVAPAVSITYVVYEKSKQALNLR